MLLFQKNIFGFEIAVNYFMFSEERKPLKYLNGDPSDEIKVQPCKFIQFQEFVQIDMEELEDKTGMTPEEKCVFELNYIRSEFGIMHECGLKDFYLYFCLTIEFRFVSDYFKCHHLFFLVIEGFENLAERTMTKSTYHFVPVSYGIASRYSSLALFIGKIFKGVYSSFANIKNLVPKDFLLLERCQEGVLLFFFCLFHLYGVTSFVG